MQVPNSSPTLDANLASMGPRILSNIGVGVWRKAEAFPDSNTILDTFQSESCNQSVLAKHSQFQAEIPGTGDAASGSPRQDDGCGSIIGCGCCE